MKGRSAISMRSLKNVKSHEAHDDEEVEPKKAMDLDEFVALACSKFVCPYNVCVKKDLQRDDHLTKLLKAEGIKHKKLIQQNLKLNTSDTDKTEETTSKDMQIIDEDTLVVTALYDNCNRLVELILQELPDIPRVLMQILSMIMPKYHALTKVTIKKCKINKYTIYELGKVLNYTSITDVCLDGSSLPEANFALLLQNTRIHSLSLARCNINDVVCETIASELHFLQPAETYLVTLNLSSNRITDEGAKHLGLALRTNRHLRYLNVSDNRIGDDGANHIIRALMYFPLTCEEIKAKRRRYMDHLKTKKEIIMKYLAEYETKSVESPSSMASKKLKHRDMSTYSPNKPPSKQHTRREAKTQVFDDLTYMRAENLACELVGPFIDPFHNNFVKLINGYCYCAGNMVLCYLNLAYNNISLMTARRLLELAKYQSMTKKLSQHGLLRVVIEGNNLPSTCTETDLLFDYLNRNVVSFSPKYKTNDTKTGRTRGRSRISIIPEMIPPSSNKS